MNYETTRFPVVTEIIDRLEIDWNQRDLALMSALWYVTTSAERLRYCRIHAREFEERHGL